jgi:glycosyltransferase involved in cell wall biosynthesis
VTGEVADTGAYLDNFAVAVAPLRIARGIQNKVLEAMAAGRPVVLTTLAATGINARNGQHYLIANDAPGTASAVVSLLQTRDRRTAVGHSARTFVQQHLNWDREMAKLDSTLIGKQPAGATRAAPTVGQRAQSAPLSA